MLGWYIAAFRFPDPGLRRARCELREMLGKVAESTGSDDIPQSGDPELRLAAWQTHLGGTEWLETLVQEGAAAKTGRGGYPNSYLIPFRELRVRLDGGLLRHGKPWMSSPGDTFLPGYLGTDSEFPTVIAATGVDEWILVEAWDES